MRAALISSFLILFCSALMVDARSSGPSEPGRAQMRVAQGRRAFEGRIASHSRDGQTSALPPLLFRQAMVRDIQVHVPLLHEKMQAIGALQEERQQLQARKREAAQAPGKPEARLQRFHELVRREDAVTSRQKAVMADTARDAGKIRAQVALRRAQIEAQLQEGGSEAEPSRLDPATTEARFLPRAARAYEVIEQRLAALQENPRRPDRARPLLKGVFFGTEERGGREKEAAERRMRELREEQERLRRRMQQIQREMDSLRGQVDDGPRPGLRHRPGPDRRSPAGDPPPPPPPAGERRGFSPGR